MRVCVWVYKVRLWPVKEAEPGMNGLTDIRGCVWVDKVGPWPGKEAEPGTSLGKKNKR